MYKMRIVLASLALLAAQQVFAETTTTSTTVSTDNDAKPCRVVAKACKAAGFARRHEGKRFWKDCMFPVVMGKTVSGVTVDAATAKACRVSKIESMKKQLQEMQSVSQ